jgi:hypothetical protein
MLEVKVFYKEEIIPLEKASKGSRQAFYRGGGGGGLEYRCLDLILDSILFRARFGFIGHLVGHHFIEHLVGGFGFPLFHYSIL